MYIYLIVLIKNTGVHLYLSPLYKIPPLLWLWSDAREKEGRTRRGGKEVFVESELAFPDKCGDLPEPPQWQ